MSNFLATLPNFWGIHFTLFMPIYFFLAFHAVPSFHLSLAFYFSHAFRLSHVFYLHGSSPFMAFPFMAFPFMAYSTPFPTSSRLLAASTKQRHTPYHSPTPLAIHPSIPLSANHPQLNSYPQFNSLYRSILSTVPLPLQLNSLHNATHIHILSIFAVPSTSAVLSLPHPAISRSSTQKLTKRNFIYTI